MLTEALAWGSPVYTVLLISQAVTIAELLTVQGIQGTPYIAARRDRVSDPCVPLMQLTVLAVRCVAGTLCVGSQMRSSQCGPSSWSGTS